MSDYLRYEVEDGIGTLTLARPEKRNAMSFAMLGDFIAAVKHAGADDAARVLIVTGSGGSFCAGTDLSDLSQTPGDQRGLRGRADEQDPSTGSGRTARWWPLVTCPKPVIGAIDGPAVGMGAEFTSQCDVRIATDRARFAWNFSHRGLVPDTGAGTWLLPRLIGLPRALRLLYSGEFLSAAEALAIGYVSQVVTPDELLDAARAEARTYLRGSPFSHQRAKALVYRGLERGVVEHMQVHTETMRECFASDDHREGVASFLERREAHFTGR